MIKRILSFVMTALMLAAFVPAAMAATTDDLNQPEVFLKQQQRGTCTLASTAMMLRRTAMLQGDESWAEITENSCREAFWLSGRGLPYNFEYEGMTVGHEFLPGGEANKEILIDLLEEHPEGIMLHASCVPHGILLTDYTDGVFYCADPAEGYPSGRFPIEQAYGTRVENSSAYWYVTSSHADVEAGAPSNTPSGSQSQLPDLAQPTTHAMSSLVAQLHAKEKQETADCLIGQAMAEAQG